MLIGACGAFSGAVLVNNQLAISQGQTVTLFSTQLSANDLDIATDNPNLIFTVSNVQHGFFQQAGNPGYPVTGFLQSQVQVGSIQFVHDGSTNPPSYSVVVSDGSLMTSPQACTIAFNLPPILNNNSLTLNQGQTLIFDSSNISATDVDTSASSLTFMISNIVGGHFELRSAPGVAILSFTQGEIQAGAVQFIQDGSPTVPRYSVAVSDGSITIPSEPSSITFAAASYITLGGDPTVSSTPSALLEGELFSSSSPRDVELGSELELHDMKKVTLDLEERQRLAERIAKIEKHLGIFETDETGGSRRSERKLLV